MSTPMDYHPNRINRFSYHMLLSGLSKGPTQLTWITALLCCGLYASCDSTDGETDDPPSTDKPIVIEEEPCQVSSASASPDYLQQISCRDDFDALSSEPLDASIPGARSTKVVLDQVDGNSLYFQNSSTYPIHYDFTSAHLSGNGLPIVPSLAEFNRVEYYMPDRRFVLGAVTYYEDPDLWALEIAPYDTASAEMIEKLYRAIQQSAYFGPALVFHPTSKAIESSLEALPSDVLIKTTDDLFAKIDYQPLNLGTSIGQLRFVHAADLDTEYLGFRDIVVLDSVPNDISVVSGLITQEFQTPLSHVNVLSQNRGTPNMALRGVMNDPQLRELDGKWVELQVGPFEFSVREVTLQDADLYWEEHKPGMVQVPGYDTSITDLRDIEDLVVVEEDDQLKDAIKAATRAFGGKASHYSVLAQIDSVPTPKAFAIPVFYYDQFMKQNGFDIRVQSMLEDVSFNESSEVRDQQLQQLRDDMQIAPVDSDFQNLLREKLTTGYSDIQHMRFRSSTNAEDLDGFTGAGLYTSRTGITSDWEDVLNAVRTVWASVWYFRAFEERSYRSIQHTAVGMAMLVHHSFPDEESNGVALTGNPFDTSGLEPGFYINVQLGESSVVQPNPGITTDQFIHYFDMPNQPTTYLSHSNLVADGETVLSRAQIHELGIALDLIHKHFSVAYGPASGNTEFYAMDVEFKFDDMFGVPGQPVLFVKQARPHPGRGQ